MLLWALVVVPLIGAAVAWVAPFRAWVIPAVAAVHAVVFLVAALLGPSGTWLALDPLATLILGQVTAVYALLAWYAPTYLRLRRDRDHRAFCTSMTAFLGALSLGLMARHLGLMWVGLESATLAAAPMLYFNRNPASIAATWKYLLIGSVGIALALLGSFFLAYSALYADFDASLAFDDLAAQAPSLSKPWLHAAIVASFVGYGTKMGLAPMHTWKADAYGEAPGLVGALLAGTLTSGAFLAILRTYQLATLAGEAEFARTLLVALGLLSMGTAAVLVVRADDFKRMLAFSSIEHVGILALGAGLGGVALYGALFHGLTSAFAKGALFLAAGNVQRAYGSKLASEVSGALARTPVSAAALLVGLFAITGAPPFGPFFSELAVLQGAAEHPWVAVAFVAFALVMFVGMGAVAVRVTLGPGEPGRERRGTTGPVLAFLAVTALLGVYLPGPVYGAIRDAAAFVEGR